MNAYEEDIYYMSDEEINWEQHLDEMADKVTKAIHDAGIHNNKMCRMFADLLSYTHEYWKESEELAEMIGVDEANIWCYKRDPESICKYKEYLRS